MSISLNTVFCQILGRDLPPETCRELQASHDPSACFGCGAFSRLCMVCRTYKPVSPELGLCTACLGDELRREKTIHRRSFARTAGPTFCQIVKKDITAEMCLATQGQEGCRLCPSPVRFCERCRRRRVFFAPYGLCLRCAVQKYEPTWLDAKPQELAVLAPVVCDPRSTERDLLGRARRLVAETGHASVSFLSEELGIVHRHARIILGLLERQGSIGPGERGRLRSVTLPPSSGEGRVTTLRKRYCSSCGKPPALLRIWSRWYCLLCARTQYPHEWATGVRVKRSPFRQVILATLVEEAKRLSRDQLVLTNKFLCKQLSIGFYLAREILTRLVNEGVITSPEQGRGCRVLCRPEQSSRPPFGRCPRCQKRPVLIVRDDVKGCLPCLRRLLGRGWYRRVAITASLREMVKEALFREVTVWAEKRSLVSGVDVGKHFSISITLARQMLERLCNAGVVGPSDVRLVGRRVVPHVLRTKDRAARALRGEIGAPHGLRYQRCTGCGEQSAVLEVGRLPLCLPCARTRYGRRWASSVRFRPDQKAAVLDALYREALQTLATEGWTSAPVLYNRLGCGPKMGYPVVRRLVREGVLKPFRRSSLRVGRMVLTKK